MRENTLPREESNLLLPIWKLKSFEAWRRLSASDFKGIRKLEIVCSSAKTCPLHQVGFCGQQREGRISADCGYFYSEFKVSVHIQGQCDQHKHGYHCGQLFVNHEKLFSRSISSQELESLFVSGFPEIGVDTAYILSYRIEKRVS